MTKSIKQKQLVFSVAHLEDDLKQHAVKSTKVTMFAQVIKLFIHLSFIAILARLLEPSDYGLFAMVAIFTSLGVVLLDGGLSMATIQKDEITHAQVSNLFWINAAVGVGLALIMLSIGPLVSWIYSQEELTLIISAMALSFIFAGFSIQHDAILRRQMRFKAIAFIDVFNIFVGGLVGIWFAYNGAGYWSLVISYLVSSLISAILKWCFAAWLPSPFRRNVGSRPLINFGTNLVAGNFVSYFTRNATPLSVGVIGGAYYLGLYNRTFALSSMVTNQVFPPVLSVLRPALARVASDDERLQRVSLSLSWKISLFSILICSTLYLQAEEIVLIMLGEKWIEAIIYLQMLVVMELAAPLVSFLISVMIAVGSVRAILKWQIITFILLAFSIAIGSNWGVLGVLITVLISVLFVRVPLFFIYLNRHISLDVKKIFQIFYIPLIIGLCTVGVVEYLKTLMSIEVALFSLVFWSFITFFTYYVLAMVIPVLRAQIIDIQKEVFNFFKKTAK